MQISRAEFLRFELLFQKWKWEEKNYRLYFQTENDLTYCSIFYNSLSIVDRRFLVEIHNRMIDNGESALIKDVVAQLDCKANQKSVFQVAHQAPEIKTCSIYAVLQT